jgi:hypothetical protein
VVVNPHQLRSYPRDSVRGGVKLELRGGVVFLLVLQRLGATARDTVYRHLSFRDAVELTPQLERFVSDGGEDGDLRVRVRETGPVRIERNRRP